MTIDTIDYRIVFTQITQMSAGSEVHSEYSAL